MKTPETAWFQVSGNFETWAQSLSGSIIFVVGKSPIDIMEPIFV